MKTILIVIAGVLLSIMAFNYPSVDFSKDEIGGIQFQKGSFSEALALAKKENKLVFLDIYASWCGPCNLLKSKTFSNAEVGKFYNANFINMAVNGEVGEGIQLATKYGVSGYPSLFYIYPNGEIAVATMGYRTAVEFLEMGKQIKSQIK